MRACRPALRAPIPAVATARQCVAIRARMVASFAQSRQSSTPVTGLVICLDGLREPVVNDTTNVGFVDAHACKGTYT